MDELPYHASLPAQGVPDPHVGTDLRAASPRQSMEAAAAQLRGRAFLYDDPDAYAAGVRDALSEFNAHLGADSEQSTPAAER